MAHLAALAFRQYFVLRYAFLCQDMQCALARVISYFDDSEVDGYMDFFGYAPTEDLLAAPRLGLAIRLGLAEKLGRDGQLFCEMLPLDISWQEFVFNEQ